MFEKANIRNYRYEKILSWLFEFYCKNRQRLGKDSEVPHDRECDKRMIGYCNNPQGGFCPVENIILAEMKVVYEHHLHTSTIKSYLIV